MPVNKIRGAWAVIEEETSSAERESWKRIRAFNNADIAFGYWMHFRSSKRNSSGQFPVRYRLRDRSGPVATFWAYF